MGRDAGGGCEMTTGKRIYIAGPYIHPDPCVNVRAAVQAAEQLVAAGFVPSPHDYEFWLAYYLNWLRLTRQPQDGMALLQGMALLRGADREVAHAKDKRILTFTPVGE